MTPAPEPRNPSPEDARDLALLQAHRAGDPTALADLLESYQDRLFGVCFRMTRDRERAGDLTQDALVKVIQGLDQFKGNSKLSTWMIRVTMNVCLTALRRDKLRKHASLDVVQSGGSSRPRGADGRPMSAALPDEREPGVDDRVEHSEDIDLLYAGMQRLEVQQRAMLILRDVQDLDYRQIAEILEVPEGTVKSRLFRARVALREQIEAARASLARQE